MISTASFKIIFLSVFKVFFHVDHHSTLKPTISLVRALQITAVHNENLVDDM